MEERYVNPREVILDLVAEKCNNIRLAILLIRTSKRFAFLKSDKFWKMQLPELVIECPAIKRMRKFVTEWRQKQKDASSDDLYFYMSRSPPMPFKGYFPAKPWLVNQKIYKRLCYLWKFMHKNVAIKKKHDKYNKYIFNNTGKILARRPIYCCICGTHCNGAEKIKYSWTSLENFSQLQKFNINVGGRYVLRRNLDARSYLEEMMHPHCSLPFCDNCFSLQKHNPRKITKSMLRYRKHFFLKKRDKLRARGRLNLNTIDFVPYFGKNFKSDDFFEVDNQLLELFLARFY